MLHTQKLATKQTCMHAPAYFRLRADHTLTPAHPKKHTDNHTKATTSPITLWLRKIKPATSKAPEITARINNTFLLIDPPYKSLSPSFSSLLHPPRTHWHTLETTNRHHPLDEGRRERVVSVWTRVFVPVILRDGCRNGPTGCPTGIPIPCGSYCELLILQVPGLLDARGVTDKERSKP